MLRQTTTLVSRLGLRGTPARCFRSQSTSSARSTGDNGRKIGFTLLAAGGLATTVAMTLPNASADSSPQPDCPPTSSIHTASYGQMARSYFVYTLCSIPLIIDYAPSLLHTFTHSPIPGLKSITEGIVRYTFFAQFVPGENVEECKPAMKDLRSKGVGTMLNYSAEADVDEHTESGDAGKRAAMVKIQDARLREVERALDQAGEFEAQVEQEGGMRGSTGFALKIVSMDRLMSIVGSLAEWIDVDRFGRPRYPTPSINDTITTTSSDTVKLPLVPSIHYCLHTIPRLSYQR